MLLNDQAYLGAHDANLIYKNKERCALENLELLGLLQSGARNLKHENIPIWYWLQHSGNEYYNLSFLTLTIPENDYSIINSILDLMALTGADIELDELFTRQDYIGNWLSDKKNFSVKNAVLRYLSEKGVEEDLIEIQKEIDRNSSQTNAMAYEAYVSIKLRSGLSSGLKAVIDLQPTILSAEIIDRLFENPSHIMTEDLQKAVENRNKVVRAKAIEILISRDLLPSHLIEVIQQDPEPGVRALAIPALLKQGANLSEDEAKAIIMKDTSKSTSDEDLAWSKFQPMILALVDSAELERRTHRLLPLSSDAYIELARRKIDAQRSELTLNLLDRYESFYHQHLRLWAEASNDDPNEILKQFDSLKEYIISKFVRKTLTLFVEKKSKKIFLLLGPL